MGEVREVNRENFGGSIGNKVRYSEVDLLKNVKNLLLREYDISVGINSEIFINILNFLMEINTDIPMKFFRDKILLHLKSPDSAQYAEVEIGSSDVLDYRPNIDGDPERKDAASVIKSKELGDYKMILVDMKGTIDELESYAPKNDIIIIKIDTVYQRKIEFHCSNNIVIWSSCIDTKMNPDIKGLENLPAIIGRVRSNRNTPKATAIMEPSTYEKICKIGGKADKRDIDDRVYIQMDKQDGMFISSGDRLKGRILEFNTDGPRFNPNSFNTGTVPLSSVGNGNEIDGVINNSESDTSYLQGFNNLEEVGSDNLEGEGFEDFLERPGFSDGRKKKDKNKDDKKPERVQGQIEQLLGMDAEATQYVYLEKGYILPFLKLKGLSPIIIEIRNEKPIILEQKPYTSIRAMLSVAPRVESSDDD